MHIVFIHSLSHPDEKPSDLCIWRSHYFIYSSLKRNQRNSCFWPECLRNQVSILDWDMLFVMVCKEVDRYLPFSPKLPLWRHFRNYRKNWQPPALTSTFWRVVYINTLSLQCLSIRLWHLMKTYIKWGLSVTSITQRLTRAGTLTVNCTEARERTGVIRFEYHKHFIWSRVESFLGRRMSSVKNSQFFRSCVFTIIDE